MCANTVPAQAVKTKGWRNHVLKMLRWKLHLPSLHEVGNLGRLQV